MNGLCRIVFLLPGAGRIPVGGFKVIYKHANGLTRRGQDAIVIHPALLNKDELMLPIPSFIKVYS